MKIVADDAIPWVEEAFSSLGSGTEISLVPGRTIDRAALSGAQVLLTRSVTRVDAALVGGSDLAMVASATAGTDHVDASALDTFGIAFAHAPGCNAVAVAEYVLACIWRFWWAGLDQPARLPVIGVVGYGNVGRRLVRRLDELGVEARVCDPFETAAIGARTKPDGAPPVAHTLDTLIDSCDVLTLHVPLTTDGPHPTRHLLDSDRLARFLARPTLLINSARGAVVDNRALVERGPGSPGLVALDVWEGEPDLRWDLLNDPRLVQTTPHIAGYSLEGKLRGTRMVYRAVCELVGAEPVWTGRHHLPGDLQLPFSPGGSDHQQRRDALVGVSEVERDSAALQQLLTIKPAERPARFEALRKDYPLRRELASYPASPVLKPLQRDDDY